MPILNRLAEMAPAIARIRRDIHAHPELDFDLPRTSALVAERLRAVGCDEVVTGLARTGVVGLIRGRAPGRTIGLRADMDALPIAEETGAPHASTRPGLMHACGHDGHTAMLLGAAEYLAETRNFAGTVAVIFQPAEEGGGGGRVMVQEGMMDRFRIDEVYGMHNMPGLPVGQFAIRPGATMAAADEFEIEVRGYGGHAARPHKTVDATFVAAQIVVALQSIVSRNVDPVESAVLTVTTIRAGGEAYNIIPSTALIGGTVRTLAEHVRDQVEVRLREVAELTARAMGAEARVSYTRDYPVVVNDPACTAFAASVAAEVVGPANVDAAAPPVLGAEDFSYMLQARPGAFIFVGNGETAPVHHPAYDFNDETIAVGCSYWVRLVETALRA